MKLLITIMIFWSILISSHAQILEDDPYKHEFRGVWIASVSNLDWPKASSYGNAASQKEELKRQFDLCKEIGLNAIILQVRPKADAFYTSSYEPWSEYLTGTRGGDPGYDPLAFAVEEAHKRSLELHAWLNPYRFEHTEGEYSGADGDYATTHPDWILLPDNTNKSFLNPGIPAVTHHIQKIVGEIVTNYDVDGIHFDDYFYSYEGMNLSDPEDQSTYETYRTSASESIGDFRRRSINEMVQAIYDTIKAIKPWVRFGISPFGIYGGGKNPTGIIGLDPYNHIYSDALAWITAGSIDYILPQLYWTTGGRQDYETLLPWWGTKAQTLGNGDVQVYAGLPTYRLSDNPGPAVSPKPMDRSLHEYKTYFNTSSSQKANEKERSSPAPGHKNAPNQRAPTDPKAAYDLNLIGNQISINRKNIDKNVYGSTFFRFSDLDRVAGLKERFRDVIYRFKAVVPAMGQPLDIPLLHPEVTSINDGTSTILSWAKEENMRYLIYAAPPEVENPILQKYLYDFSYDASIVIPNTVTATGKELYVTAFDRYGNESESENIISSTPTITDKDPEIVFFYDTKNQMIHLTLQLKNSSELNIKIYNLLGYEVANLTEKNLQTRTYHYSYDASKLATGLYICKIRNDKKIWNHKLVVSN